MKLTVLLPDEIDALHQATLSVLGDTGIILSYPPAIDILVEAGSVIEQDRIKIPAPLVESALANCKKPVSLTGRGGDMVSLGDGSLHWHNLGGAREIFDPLSGKRRKATVQEVVQSTRLLDALDEATAITPFFTPQDVPGALMSLAMYRHTLPHTTKPVHGPGVQTAAEVGYILRMAEVIGPPSRVLSLSASPISPLTFPDHIASAIIEIADAGVTFAPLPCPTAGATAPMSISGALTLQNAEILACLVLAQLVHPGLPVVYSGRLAMMDPRTGLSVWGGVELGLASAATVQVGHHYGLPVNVYGFSTNAHTLDLQNGAERALNAVTPALAGADELSGIGEMEAGVMGSYAQMVCDNEIAAGIRRLRAGLQADQDALAVEVIATALRSSRNFLAQPHTKRYLRSGEISLTQLAERRSWEVWEREHRQGMTDRAQDQAGKILAQHQVPPLSDHQERELDAIMLAAGRELAAY
jgi:trimethylamine--corrinoid protein Co-methyltransferase